MGERGIRLDSLGRVLRRESIFEASDDKVVAPKPWKACKSPVLPRSNPWDEESMFNEAGQEIQTIIFRSLNLAYQRPWPNSNTSETEDMEAQEAQEPAETHFAVFSASPCFSSTPVTPPTRSQNPIVLDSSFESSRTPEGAEIGLLSVSPPPKIFGTTV
jgi:hypothetical protein